MNLLIRLAKALYHRLSDDSGKRPGVAGDEKGAAVVLFAIMVTALLGMGAISVDAGMLYSARNQLANAADAAALGGAQLLPDNPARAVEVAQQVAVANGADPDKVLPEIGPDGRSLSVSITHVVPLAFARALNRNEATVGAASTATAGTLTAVRGVAPFGIPQADFVEGGLYTLKIGSGEGEHEDEKSGNFHALSLGGRGATIYQDNIINGYSEVLRVGDQLETEPGNMHGPTEAGIRSRLEAEGDDHDNDGKSDDEDDDDHDGLPDIEHGSKRLLIVPMVDGFENANGRDRVTVVGFAAFYLKGFGSGTDEVVGRFVAYVANGEAGNGTDFGIRVVKLTR